MIPSLKSLTYHYAGLKDYSSTLKYMQSRLKDLVQSQSIECIGVQHPLTYTSGVTFSEKHLVSPNLQIHKVRRGGSVTVHNPGQLTIYTLIPLKSIPFSLEHYIRILETTIIHLLALYNIPSFINPPHTGVWTSKGKIAFIGLGVQHQCIFHGISINVSNNLNDYKNIYSCGLNLPITNILQEIENKQVLSDKYIVQIAQSFIHIFERYIFTKFKPIFCDWVNYLQNIINFPPNHFTIGQTFFNARLFWYAHESWEIYWKMSTGEFRSFLQGNILLASAYFKLTEKFSLKGAISLLKKSQSKLQKNMYVYEYIKKYNKQTLLEHIQNTISILEKFTDKVYDTSLQLQKEILNTISFFIIQQPTEDNQYI